MHQQAPSPAPRLATRRYAEPFRSRRIQSPAFSQGLFAAFAAQPQLRGVGIDVSSSGVKLRLPRAAADAMQISPGQRIDGIELRYFDKLLFQGAGEVRHTAAEGNNLFAGIELHGPNVAIDTIHQQSVRLDFRYRLEALIERTKATSDQASASFDAWLDQSEAMMRALHAFLSAEDEALKRMDIVTRDQTRAALKEELHTTLVPVFLNFRDALNRQVANFTEDQHAHYRPLFRERLGKMVWESDFIWRAYNKPMGYAGDFELMSILYRPVPDDLTLFGSALSMHSKDEPAGRATINRLEYMTKVILAQEAIKEGRRLDVASVGCGAAKELVHLLTHHPEVGKQLNVVLLDQDTQALEVCERTLTPLSQATGATFSFINDPIQSLIREQNLGACLGNRDLIYSVGLYDYLDDGIFHDLTGVLFEALKPKGRVVIGNMAAHNPTLQWMAYAMDWFLIHRSSEELQRLGESITGSADQTLVDAEPVGVNLFLHLWK